ncbi:MAG: VCBS repeat-containing protein [Planctomycetaceae bacterium]
MAQTSSLRACRLFGMFAIALSATSVAAQEFPATFEITTIDPNIGKVCYAIVTADVNNDARPDIVALSENRVVWYEAPAWTPHVILQDQLPLDHVTIAPHDIDHDGQVDFAIGAGWTKTGTLHWIRRKKDSSGLWEVFAVGEETSVHRIRWADVLGKGSPQLVVSPLNASTGSGVRLLAFEIPKTPESERWQATVLNADLNRMHNHWHLDFDADGVVDTLTASREGVSLIRKDGTGWSSVRLSEGKTGESDPNSNGAGEVKSGKLSNGRRFLATVEPMHGDSLAVYLEPKSPSEAWERIVIQDGFRRGHAVWTADFNGDGSDEIVFGHSDTPQKFGVMVFWSSKDKPEQWTRQILDEGEMATEDLTVTDLTGDGVPDIVAGGRSTHNVRLYSTVIKAGTR